MLPKRLYKYKPMTNQNIENLRNEVIWIPTPNKFNDPFDCNIKFFGQDQYFKSLPLYLSVIGIANHNVNGFASIIQSEKQQGKTDSEVIAIIESTLKSQGQQTLMAQLDDYEARFRSDVVRIGVLSLSERPDDILMWSHYAEYHTGFCLEFSTEEPHKDGSLILADQSRTKQVEYSDYYPSILDMKIFDATEDDMIRNNIILKSKQWEYEREWRILTGSGNKTFSYPGKLTRIIFGARVDDKKSVEVMEAIASTGSNVGIAYSVMREDKFAVGIVDI